MYLSILLQLSVNIFGWYDYPDHYLHTSALIDLLSEYIRWHSRAEYRDLPALFYRLIDTLTYNSKQFD